jgi:hypothetical protein
MGGGFLALTLAAPAFKALSPGWATVAAIFPAGLAVIGVSFINVTFTTLRQQLPPAELRGRVIAASRTLSWAGLPVGAALGGAAAEAFGVRPVYLASSAAIVAIALLLTTGSLWRISAPGGEEGPAGSTAEGIDPV